MCPRDCCDHNERGQREASWQALNHLPTPIQQEKLCFMSIVYLVFYWMVSIFLFKSILCSSPSCLSLQEAEALNCIIWFSLPSSWVQPMWEEQQETGRQKRENKECLFPWLLLFEVVVWQWLHSSVKVHNSYLVVPSYSYSSCQILLTMLSTPLSLSQGGHATPLCIILC